MPIVIVYGMPRVSVSTSALRELINEGLPAAVASVPEMGIRPDQVTVFMPEDTGIGSKNRTEIIVFIEGMFRRDARTPEVRQAMAEAVAACMKAYASEHVPHCTLIEVVPRSQNADDGFVSQEYPRGIGYGMK